MKEENSIRDTVAKMMTDAKVVAALSDQTPPTPQSEAAVRRAYERLWGAYQDALARIESLEVQLALWADSRWRN